MNVGTGIDIIHDDEEIVEKKIELMDIPEHNLDEGDVFSKEDALVNSRLSIKVMIKIKEL